MNLTNGEAAVLLATVIFLGFTSVTVVVGGADHNQAIAFNAIGFVSVLFVAAYEGSNPLERLSEALQ